MMFPRWLETTCVVTATAISVLLFADSRYLGAVADTNNRIERKWANDERRELEADIRALEREYGFNCQRCPSDVLLRYEQLIKQLERVKETLKELEKK